jgi:hypothetical protein
VSLDEVPIGIASFKVTDTLGYLASKSRTQSAPANIQDTHSANVPPCPPHFWPQPYHYPPMGYYGPPMPPIPTGQMVHMPAPASAGVVPAAAPAPSVPTAAALAQPLVLNPDISAFCAKHNLNTGHLGEALTNVGFIIGTDKVSTLSFEDVEKYGVKLMEWRRFVEIYSNLY